MADESKVAPKPAPEAKPEPQQKAKDIPPKGMTDEEFAALRHDIRRMWAPEPEETR